MRLVQSLEDSALYEALGRSRPSRGVEDAAGAHRRQRAADAPAPKPRCSNGWAGWMPRRSTGAATGTAALTLRWDGSRAFRWAARRRACAKADRRRRDVCSDCARICWLPLRAFMPRECCTATSTPENLLASAGERVTVLDFGRAQWMTEGGTVRRAGIGYYYERSWPRRWRPGSCPRRRRRGARAVRAGVAGLPTDDRILLRRFLARNGPAA